MSVIIGICNNKGGAGKTTLSILVAWHLARLGYSTLVVDGDPQANCSETLVGRKKLRELRAENDNAAKAASEDGKIGPVTFSHQLFMETLPSPLKAYDRGLHGVSVIPAMINDPKLSQIEGVSWDHVTNPRNHMVSLAQAGRYDIILIDTPPVMGRLQVGWIHSCDYIVMPLQLSPYAMSGPEGLSETLQDLEKNAGYAPKLLGVVANNFNSRSKDQVEKVRAYREELGDLMFDTELPSRTPITESISKRDPLWHSKNGSARQANRMVKMLVSEIMERAGIEHV